MCYLITVAIISVNLRSDSTVCKSVISRLNHLLVITNKNTEQRCTSHDFFFFSALLLILSKHVWPTSQMNYFLYSWRKVYEVL